MPLYRFDSELPCGCLATHNGRVVDGGGHDATRQLAIVSVDTDTGELCWVPLPLPAALGFVPPHHFAGLPSRTWPGAWRVCCRVHEA